VFLSRNKQGNAEFAIADAILGLGGSDKARGRGRREGVKNCLPEKPSSASRRF